MQKHFNITAIIYTQTCTFTETLLWYTQTCRDMYNLSNTESDVANMQLLQIIDK